jgi:hypothetical protein
MQFGDFYTIVDPSNQRPPQQRGVGKILHTKPNPLHTQVTTLSIPCVSAMPQVFHSMFSRHTSLTPLPSSGQVPKGHPLA